MPGLSFHARLQLLKKFGAMPIYSLSTSFGMPGSHMVKVEPWFNSLVTVIRPPNS
jgi:hypothetical protein